MKGVRSALYHGVELSSRRMAKLRRELVLQQRKFRNRVIRNKNQRTGHGLVVIVYPSEHEAVVARTLPADRWSRACPDAAAGWHGGTQQRKFQNAVAQACRGGI